MLFPTLASSLMMGSYFPASTKTENSSKEHIVPIMDKHIPSQSTSIRHNECMDTSLDENDQERNPLKQSRAFPKCIDWGDHDQHKKETLNMLKPNRKAR